MPLTSTQLSTSSERFFSMTLLVRGTRSTCPWVTQRDPPCRLTASCVLRRGGRLLDGGKPDQRALVEVLRRLVFEDPSLAERLQIVRRPPPVGVGVWPAEPRHVGDDGGVDPVLDP